MTVDTSHDDGERQGGIECGYHWGYSYTCKDCKSAPATDPLDDYRTIYGPDPEIDDRTPEQMIEAARQAKRAEEALIADARRRS